MNTRFELRIRSGNAKTITSHRAPFARKVTNEVCLGIISRRRISRPSAIIAPPSDGFPPKNEAFILRRSTFRPAAHPSSGGGGVERTKRFF
ncbi:hypothetical protein EVAR_27292_1 [Eumeta japonica]|uniref:Uncharacterized protein n=1 Tax=Eumeta variegata TaxID=151549 RepID=A0A4C1UCI7_EUMVA|nr:hypothetical protein EVAR_27292_1 [Eumeta japonica]